LYTESRPELCLHFFLLALSSQGKFRTSSSSAVNRGAGRLVAGYITAFLGDKVSASEAIKSADGRVYLHSQSDEATTIQVRGRRPICQTFKNDDPINRWHLGGASFTISGLSASLPNLGPSAPAGAERQQASPSLRSPLRKEPGLCRLINGPNKSGSARPYQIPNVAAPSGHCCHIRSRYVLESAEQSRRR
jgi:hypothetical protein